MSSRLERGRRARRLRERAGLVLLLVALAFQAATTLPEAWIERASPNDLVFHRVASERLLAAIRDGEPFLDPWVSEWSLGYPVWRSYQPLPHLVGAAWIAATKFVASPAASFAVLDWLLLAALPASVFAGARLLGLTRFAAGVASLLVLLPSEANELGRYGLGAGAFTWRGSGLFTQLVALHFLVLALGLSRRAADGRGRASLAALAIAATALSHIVFAYVAFVSGAVVALVGPARGRPRRAARFAIVAAAALLLVSWFYVPLALDLSFVNRSRWEDAFKWDSFGAARVLGDLASGRLLDAGRWPLLTILPGAAALVCTLEIRRTIAARLLGLTGAWLLLFFGRTTWGHVLDLLAIPSSFHLHRLQGAFELCACFLAAHGLERGLRRLRRSPAALAAAAALLAAGASVLLYDRAHFLRQNAAWGETNLAKREAERSDVDSALTDVRSILTERPGRVSAGKAADWGRTFRVGSLPFFAILSEEHLDEASFLYHAMSKTSDVMVLRDERDLAHDVALGIRAVVAPAELPLPASFRLRGRHGRFAVYEASPEGYFGLVDIGARYEGPAVGDHDVSAWWLQSAELRRGVVVALRGPADSLPSFGRWEPTPPSSTPKTARGSVLSEDKTGERYHARIALARPCHAFVKITYVPGLVATVDGKPVPVRPVTPGFAAVPVPAGVHEVEVRWQPGPLKPLLFAIALVLFAGFAFTERSASALRAERRLAGVVAAVAEWVDTPPIRTAAATGALLVVALHPLLATGLVDGALARLHPPRLIELARAVGDGHVPPVWAPDLASGHGLPIFEFVPPLADSAAFVAHALGVPIAEALQLSLFALFVAGAAAVVALARDRGASQAASIAVVACWSFSPLAAHWLFAEADFASGAAFAVLPLAWLAVVRATRRARVGASIFLIAPLLLADHGVAALAVAALVALVWIEGGDRHARLRGLAAIVGACALTAFHWLPVLAEASLVRWLSPASPAAIPIVQIAFPWAASVGPAAGLGLVLVLGIAGVFVGPRERARERALLGGFALLGAALATPLGTPIRSALPASPSAMAALAVPALACSLLAAAVFDRIGTKTTSVAVAIVATLTLMRGPVAPPLTFDDAFYTPRSIAERGMHAAESGAWQPRSASAAPAGSELPLIPLSGIATVIPGSSTTTGRAFDVRASSTIRWRAATFAYPDWRVTIDGVETPTEADASGMIVFDGPAGDHRVELLLRSSSVRRQASLLSGLALLAALAAALHGLRFRSRERLRASG